MRFRVDMGDLEGVIPGRGILVKPREVQGSPTAKHGQGRRPARLRRGLLAGSIRIVIARQNRGSASIQSAP